MNKLSILKKAFIAFVFCASTASVTLGQTGSVTPPPATFKTLHSFDVADGYEPSSQVVQGGNGQLYGTTLQGGPGELGSIFAMTPAGNLTFDYNFDGANGGEPVAGLVQATDGNLYGINPGDTIYRVTPTGVVSTLYAFCLQSGCPDGTYPVGGLIQGSDGNLYGTTQQGGANGEGTIFRITLGGSLTTLHSFTGADGSYPSAALVQATNGNFYGTTRYGGAGNQGTVFEITPGGKFSSLYSFCSQSNCADGQQPASWLIQGADGLLYGATLYGGTGNLQGPCACGTIFTITLTGSLAVLHSFDYTDGSLPVAGLVQGTDGNLYGVSSEGGAGNGTAFSISPSGTLTTLHNFCAQTCLDGGAPTGGLYQVTDGNFYGTAPAGGEYGAGTAFQLSVGLGPFVRTIPSAGRVEEKIEILGTNLAGATNVIFNGVAAKFNVISKTLIAATVPAGATTGTVRVKLPAGPLSSNAPFQVLP